MHTTSESEILPSVGPWMYNLGRCFMYDADLHGRTVQLMYLNGTLSIPLLQPLHGLSRWSRLHVANHILAYRVILH